MPPEWVHAQIVHTLECIINSQKVISSPVEPTGEGWHGIDCIVHEAFHEELVENRHGGRADADGEDCLLVEPDDERHNVGANPAGHLVGAGEEEHEPQQESRDAAPVKAAKEGK